MLLGVPVVLAITLHEAAHGYVARIFGDQTAWMLGRVTLNPFKHIDPIGTVLVPRVLLLTRAVPVRLGEAGAGQFRQPAPSEAGHDLGGRRGSRGEFRHGAAVGVAAGAAAPAARWRATGCSKWRSMGSW